MKNGSTMWKVRIRCGRCYTLCKIIMEWSWKWQTLLGALLIDARNAFNEGNCKMMVCIARHEWPSGSRFFLSCTEITLCWLKEVKRCQNPYFFIAEKGRSRFVRVCWMKLRGTKTGTSLEKGREEFLESLNSSHALLDKKNNLFGHFTFILKAKGCPNYVYKWE